MVYVNKKNNLIDDALGDILDLGCGKKKRPGALGVDNSNRHDADVIHDLNEFPYPFAANTFGVVYMDNVLEHLNSPLEVMCEVNRILKPGGIVKVIVPYFRSPWAYIDPTHKHFFTVDSFAYYDPSHAIRKRYDYVDAKFKVEKVVFNEDLPIPIIHLVKRIVCKFANLFPNYYEVYLSHFFPLDDITYYLRKIE
jgi:SAM-dependent methyltransferase